MVETTLFGSNIVALNAYLVTSKFVPGASGSIDSPLRTLQRQRRGVPP